MADVLLLKFKATIPVLDVNVQIDACVTSISKLGTKKDLSRGDFQVNILSRIRKVSRALVVIV